MSNFDLKRRLQAKLFARDHVKAAEHRIRTRVELVAALYAAGKSPSRAVIRELNLECYVYPLPPWQPGELERWGLT